MPGYPIAVTLLEQDSYERLTAAAVSGSFLMHNGNRAYATQVFRTLGLNGSGAFTSHWFPMIIVNGLPQALTLSDSCLGNHSTQIYYPLESDLTDSFQAGNGALKQDQIPGSRSHPYKPGVKLYGAGVYAFDMGVAFNYGALSFSYGEDKPLLGISWSHGPLCVSADLSAYKDLEDFYNLTSGKGGSSAASNTDLSIVAGSGLFGAVDVVGQEKPWSPKPSAAVFVAVAPK